MESFEGGEVSEVSGGEGQVENQPPAEAQEQDTQELPPPDEGGETAAGDVEDDPPQEDLSDEELAQPDETDPAQDANLQAVNETENNEINQPETPETTGSEGDNQSDNVDDSEKEPLKTDDGEDSGDPDASEKADNVDDPDKKQLEDEKQLDDPGQPDEETQPESKTEDPKDTNEDDQNLEDPEGEKTEGEKGDEQPDNKDQLDQKELEEPKDQTEEEQPEDRLSPYDQMRENGKEAYENASGPEAYTKDGEAYKPLTQEEKENLSNQNKDLIDSIPKDERGDLRVQEPEKIKGVTPGGKIVEAWKEDYDGSAKDTRHMETPKAGSEFDRIGSEKGNYVSPLDENGKPYPLEQRAIGDYLPEKNIEDNPSYHRYRVDKDFTQDNFLDAIDQSDYDQAKKDDLLDQLVDYYKDCADDKGEGHVGETFAPSEREADGVKASTIGPMFTDNDGGAPQYILPFDIETLKDLKMISNAG